MPPVKPELDTSNGFYDNLTLGLNKLLRNVPNICDICCERRQPCEKVQVVNWEQRHGVYLPDDMKKFYLSTDGFILQWSYKYGPTETRRVGHIHFPHLLQITLLRENIDPLPSLSPRQQVRRQTAASQNKDLWGNATPKITAKSKMFEINNVNDVAKVCMIYDSVGTSNPKFYLLELETLQWQFLADNFSEYLRMAIAHLGLPHWELCFSTFGLPSWAEQLFLLLAPHLLEDHEPRRSRIINPAAENPHNTIDTDIFKSKIRGPTKKKSTTNVKDLRLKQAREHESEE